MAAKNLPREWTFLPAPWGVLLYSCRNPPLISAHPEEVHKIRYKLFPVCLAVTAALLADGRSCAALGPDMVGDGVVLSNERGQILLKNLLIVGEGEDGHTLLIHTEGLFKQLVFL